MLSSRKINRY